MRLDPVERRRARPCPRRPRPRTSRKSPPLCVAAPDPEGARGHLRSLLRRPRRRVPASRSSILAFAIVDQLAGGPRAGSRFSTSIRRRRPSSRPRCTSPTRRSRREDRRGCGAPRLSSRISAARVTASAVISSERIASASCQPGLYWLAPGAFIVCASCLERLELDDRRLQLVLLADDVDVAWSIDLAAAARAGGTGWRRSRG